MIRAVLDVNVVVSAVIGPFGYARTIATAWRAGSFSPITASGIVAEVAAKLSLPRISRRYHVTDDDVRWIVGLLRTQAEEVPVSAKDCVEVTGVPEDDYVLATARLGRADYLVTGDQGLLALDHYEGVAIVSPRAFVEVLEREPGGTDT